MQKFTKQLPKEDLKKFAKEVGKKLVASDFSHGRVEDPTKISEKQEKKVKNYVRDFFEKAVEKKKVMDRRKAEKAKLNGNASQDLEAADAANGKLDADKPLKEDSDVEMSDNDDAANDSILNAPSPTVPETPSLTESSIDLKRKREDDDLEATPGEDSESNKRMKEDSASADIDISPPPPPPPPPALDGGFDAQDLVKEETEEEKELRLQEEDLMRENEEAMMMDLDGTLKAEEEEGKLHSPLLERNKVAVNSNALLDGPAVNGGGASFEVKLEDAIAAGEEESAIKHERKQEGVMSH